jgi:hypothetical protein
VASFAINPSSDSGQVEFLNDNGDSLVLNSANDINNNNLPNFAVTCRKGDAISITEGAQIAITAPSGDNIAISAQGGGQVSVEADATDGVLLLGAKTVNIGGDVTITGPVTLQTVGAPLACAGAVEIAGPTPTTLGGSGIALGATTATSASAGSASLPSAPEGFLEINIAGTVRKIPYYAV